MAKLHNKNRKCFKKKKVWYNWLQSRTQFIIFLYIHIHISIFVIRVLEIFFQLCYFKVWSLTHASCIDIKEQTQKVNKVKK
jgi:hypothetical protein